MKLFKSTCDLTLCFHRWTKTLQVNAGLDFIHFKYCDKHAKIADEMFRNKEININADYDYEPLDN